MRMADQVNIGVKLLRTSQTQHQLKANPNLQKMLECHDAKIQEDFLLSIGNFNSQHKRLQNGL